MWWLWVIIGMKIIWAAYTLIKHPIGGLSGHGHIAAMILFSALFPEIVMPYIAVLLIYEKYRYYMSPKCNTCGHRELEHRGIPHADGIYCDKCDCGHAEHNAWMQEDMYKRFGFKLNKRKSCQCCADTGIWETGNNDLPCKLCPAGRDAKFNDGKTGLNMYIEHGWPIPSAWSE